MIVWERKTKILLEIKSIEGNIGDIVLEKVNWVNDHKDTIIRAFLEENDDCIDAVNEMIEDGALEVDGKISEDEFVKALFVNNVTVFVNLSVKENAVIKELSTNLQTKIKTTIKKTSDLEVKEVNIKVKDIEPVKPMTQE